MKEIPVQSSKDQIPSSSSQNKMPSLIENDISRIPLTDLDLNKSLNIEKAQFDPNANNQKMIAIDDQSGKLSVVDANVTESSLNQDENQSSSELAMLIDDDASQQQQNVIQNRLSLLSVNRSVNSTAHSSKTMKLTPIQKLRIKRITPKMEDPENNDSERYVCENVHNRSSQTPQQSFKSNQSNNVSYSRSYQLRVRSAIASKTRASKYKLPLSPRIILDRINSMSAYKKTLKSSTRASDRAKRRLSIKLTRLSVKRTESMFCIDIHSDIFDFLF